jgi:hypothetical protein
VKWVLPTIIGNLTCFDQQRYYHLFCCSLVFSVPVQSRRQVFRTGPEQTIPNRLFSLDCCLSPPPLSRDGARTGGPLLSPFAPHSPPRRSPRICTNLMGRPGRGWGSGPLAPPLHRRTKFVSSSVVTVCSRMLVCAEDSASYIMWLP